MIKVKTDKEVLLLRICFLIIIYFVSSIILLYSFGRKANAFPVDLSPLSQRLLLLGLIPNMVAPADFVWLPEGSSQLLECSRERVLQRPTKTVVALRLIKTRKWASPHALKFLLSLLSKSPLLSYFTVRLRIASHYPAEWSFSITTENIFFNKFGKHLLHHNKVFIILAYGLKAGCHSISGLIIAQRNKMSWKLEKKLRISPFILFFLPIWFATLSFSVLWNVCIHYGRKPIFYIFFSLLIRYSSGNRLSNSPNLETALAGYIPKSKGLNSSTKQGL